MHETQFSEEIPYGGFSQIRSHILVGHRGGAEVGIISSNHHCNHNINCYYVYITLPQSYMSCRSLDDPPDHPAFKIGRDKKPNQVQALTTAVTEMARAMTSSGSSAPMTSVTASTLPTGPTTTAGISPGKVANLRSNYLQQIRDLHSLFEN